MKNPFKKLSPSEYFMNQINLKNSFVLYGRQCGKTATYFEYLKAYLEALEKEKEND